MKKFQIHNRLTIEQVKLILKANLAREITSSVAREKLGLGKTRFFALLKQYRESPETFSIQNIKTKPTNQISPDLESLIITELKKEKDLIQNKDIPIKFYNYSAIRDTVMEASGKNVALTTIINRAKQHGYYLERKKLKNIHDREVLTNFIGELIQHDASIHQFSPLIQEKFVLITSLDDYSRLLVFAELFPRETSWYHISALQSVITKFGCPLKYYSDQHSIFRFVKDRDKNSPWNTYQKFTDDVSPQWKQVLEDCGIEAVYALSPQAKGKIERPYRWLQDRIVRTAFKKNITTLEELRIVLKELVHLYNSKWVHSTTKEIPYVRFEKALNEDRSLFKPLELKTIIGQTTQDIFCLRITRTVDAYRKISLDKTKIQVPNGFPRTTVDIRIIPDFENNLAELRFWQKFTFLGSQKIKLSLLKTVQF